MDSPLNGDSQAFHLWVNLLLAANHKEGETLVNYGNKKLKAGQLLTSRKRLSSITGIQESKVTRLLNLFIKMNLIEQQTFNKFRVISITNWHKYQVREQQMNSKRTTNEQQMNTYNNDNNDNNVNKKQEERVYPSSLNLSAWREYIAYRREARIRKLTTKGEEKQIEKIIGFGGFDIQQESIDQTIANGWQGVFPPSGSSPHKSKATTFIDRVLDDGFH